MFTQRLPACLLPRGFQTENPNAFLIAPHACRMPNDSVHTPAIILILPGDVPEIRRSPLLNFLDASAATSSPSIQNPYLIKDDVSTEFRDKMALRHCLLLFFYILLTEHLNIFIY